MWKFFLITDLFFVCLAILLASTTPVMTEVPVVWSFICSIIGFGIGIDLVKMNERSE